MIIKITELTNSKFATSDDEAINLRKKIIKVVEENEQSEIDLDGIMFMSTRFANLSFALALEEIAPEEFSRVITITNADDFNKNKINKAIEKGREMYGH
ncbi:MAG: STAS-like domain-containing protein [Culicoidibacterales bacterium]